MNIQPMQKLSSLTVSGNDAPRKAKPLSPKQLEVKEKFQDFAAGTFYRTMLKSMRSTLGKPAYFHGGRAEEVFQGQLDEEFTAAFSRTHGESFAGPLFKAYAQQTPATLDARV